MVSIPAVLQVEMQCRTTMTRKPQEKRFNEFNIKRPDAAGGHIDVVH